MREFRITRPKHYKIGTAGHDDVNVREGHLYKVSGGRDDAIALASRAFPGDLNFDIQEKQPDGYSQPLRVFRSGD